MKQTRSHSLIEATTNTVAGWFVSYLLNIFALPYWGFNPTPADAFEISILFIFASLIRGYVVRRVFNR